MNLWAPKKVLTSVHNFLNGPQFLKSALHETYIKIILCGNTSMRAGVLEVDNVTFY